MWLILADSFYASARIERWLSNPPRPVEANQ
jgi:hypothetical protein